MKHCWYISMIGWRGTNPCILQLSYRSTSKPRVSWTVCVEGCTSTLNIELIFPPQAHSDISDTAPDYQRAFAIYRIIGPFSFTQRSILPFHLFHQNWQPHRLWWSTLQGRKRAFGIKLMGSSGKSKRDLHAQPFPTGVSKNCYVEEKLAHMHSSDGLPRAKVLEYHSPSFMPLWRFLGSRRAQRKLNVSLRIWFIGVISGVI